MIGNRNPDYRNPWFCSEFCMVLFDFCVSCVKSLAFGLLQFALGPWPFAIAIGNLQLASGPWPPGIGQWKFAPEPWHFMIGTRNPYYRSLGFSEVGMFLIDVGPSCVKFLAPDPLQFALCPWHLAIAPVKFAICTWLLALGPWHLQLAI